MKRLIAIIAAFVLFGALGSAWAADAPSLILVSARRHHVTRHHTHKAPKHRQTKHRRTV